MLGRGGVSGLQSEDVAKLQRGAATSSPGQRISESMAKVIAGSLSNVQEAVRTAGPKEACGRKMSCLSVFCVGQRQNRMN